MKISESSLREIIREEIINEISTKGPHTKGPGIILSRVGGLSSVPQDDAPTRAGIWGFIWPYFEPFLLGSTDHAGIVDGDRPSRYELMKKNKRKDPSLSLRKGRYVGKLYTRIPGVPGAEVDEGHGWALVDADELRKYVFGRMKPNDYTSMARKDAVNRKLGKTVMFDENPSKEDYLSLASRMSKDHYEVFIPRGFGKFVG
jgi:hypothetical protein